MSFHCATFQKGKEYKVDYIFKQQILGVIGRWPILRVGCMLVEAHLHPRRDTLDIFG